METAAIRRILVAVDFSSCSRAALVFACKLGAALHASLAVTFVGSNEGDGSPSTAAAAKEELHRFVETVPESRALTLSEHVVHGDARERIVALSEGFDLIVLGTHGRTGRPRSLAGSVAESVVRTASRPVLTVRES